MQYIDKVERVKEKPWLFFIATGSSTGGIYAQDFAKVFYKSKKWQRCRKSFIDNRITIDGGLCEECHKNPGYIVHHKVTLSSENINNAEISLNHDLLEYVCKDCHDLFEGHGLNKGIKPLCTFDENGQPISLRAIDRSIEGVAIS